MAQLMSIKRNVEIPPGIIQVPAVFHVSQYDVGTRLILGLLNNNTNYTIPDGTTAIIRGRRPDNTTFPEVTCTIDSTSELKFNLTAEMSAIPGPVVCEGVMTSGTNVCATTNFIIDVERSPIYEAET